MWQHQPTCFTGFLLISCPKCPHPASFFFLSSWTRAADEPAELEDDAEPLIEEEEDPSGWSVAPSASGRPFFWHRISRRSVWKLPPGASVRKKKGRKKRKKRRKKKTPKSSSFRSSSGVRPRRCGQGSRFRSSSFGGCGVFVNMYDKFQQSPIYSGRCLLPFLRLSGGHSCYACRDVYTQCKLQKTVVLTGAVLGQCLRLALVVSASVRLPTLTRNTPFTSCVCHPSVAWE